MTEIPSSLRNLRKTCSFCHQFQGGGRELIQSSTSETICNECVREYARFVDELPEKSSSDRPQTDARASVVDALGELVQVVPVGQTEVACDIAVTILSVELYSEGFLVNGRIRVLSRLSQSNPSPYRLVVDSSATVTLHDSDGRAYRLWARRGSGDRHEFRLRHYFQPALDPQVEQLGIVIADLRGIVIDESRPDDRDADVVLHGPWSFTISTSAR